MLYFEHQERMYNIEWFFLVSHLQPIFYHNFCDESYSVASMVHIVSEPSPGWKYDFVYLNNTSIFLNVPLYVLLTTPKIMLNGVLSNFVFNHHHFIGLTTVTYFCGIFYVVGVQLLLWNTYYLSHTEGFKNVFFPCI